MDPNQWPVMQQETWFGLIGWQLQNYVDERGKPIQS